MNIKSWDINLNVPNVRCFTNHMLTGKPRTGLLTNNNLRWYQLKTEVLGCMKDIQVLTTLSEHNIFFMIQIKLMLTTSKPQNRPERCCYPMQTKGQKRVLWYWPIRQVMSSSTFQNEEHSRKTQNGMQGVQIKTSGMHSTGDCTVCGSRRLKSSCQDSNVALLK